MHFLCRCLLSCLVALTALNVAQADEPKKYLFPQAPVEILDEVANAKYQGTSAFQEPLRSLLFSLWKDRNGSKSPLAQADDRAVRMHLVASGVTDAKALDGYLKRFNDLAAEAEKSLSGLKTPQEKADKLLRFLHAGVMAKGYEGDQSRLDVLFETGKFNCVSSSCLYYLVGTRLGLELKGVVMRSSFLTGHVAVDLVVDGKRIELEPTNADGYDWPEKLKKPGVISFSLGANRSTAHDVDGFGLAASIATNHAISAAKADPPRYGEAVRFSAIGLVLHPTDDSASDGMLSAFDDPARALAKAGKFEDSLVVYSLARRVLGGTGHLNRNCHVAWEDYIDAEFAAGRIQGSLLLVARAAKDLPEVRDFQSVVDCVKRAARQKLRKDGWTAGLSFADEAIKLLPDADRKEIVSWKSGTRRLWSQEFLGKRDPAGSYKVLRDGFSETPEDRDLISGLHYHLQAALPMLAKDKGIAEAAAHLAEAKKAFPKLKDLGEHGDHFAHRMVRDLGREKKFEQALAAVNQYKVLTEKPDDLLEYAHEVWIDHLRDEKDWKGSLDRCKAGLKDLPKNDRLVRLGRLTVDRWAGVAMDKKDWTEAIRIYKVGLEYFPGDGHLEHNKKYCEENLKP